MRERKRELEAQHVRFWEFDRGVEFPEFFLANLNRYGLERIRFNKCVMLQSLTFCGGARVETCLLTSYDSTFE